MLQAVAKWDTAYAKLGRSMVVSCELVMWALSVFRKASEDSAVAVGRR